MNLEEMKAALASEATKKAERYEKEIKRLNKEIREKDEQIKQQGDVLRTMFNRCIVFSKGLMCLFCGERKRCDEMRSVGRGKDGTKHED